MPKEDSMSGLFLNTQQTIEPMRPSLGSLFAMNYLYGEFKVTKPIEEPREENPIIFTRDDLLKL